MISCSNDAFRILYPQLADLSHEEFWFLHLNRGNRLMKMERLSIGGVSGTSVDVRLVIKSALEQRSSSLILAHNHPSGNLQASQSDRQMTQKIREAAALFDIQIADHLIVGQESYFSFADAGWL